MQKLEMALLRATQLIFCLFYTSTILVYASAVIVIPLAVLMGVINLLDQGIGFNGIFAFIVATPAVCWLFYKLYLIPNMSSILMNTGSTLLQMGVKNFRDFDTMATTLKGGQNPQQANTAN